MSKDINPKKIGAKIVRETMPHNIVRYDKICYLKCTIRHVALNEV